MSLTNSILRHFFWSVLILISACGPANLLRVESMNFDQQIDQFQNLEFNFNRDMAVDSVFNRWDSAEYIKITPAIPGRFKWTSARQLVFSPAVPFAPNTDYTATLTKKLSELSGKKYQPETGGIRFHTPYLTIDQAYAYWGVSEADPGQVQLRMIIVFNYEIEPGNIRSFLSVRNNDKSLMYDLISRGNPAEAELAIPVNNGTAPEGEITIVMGKGIQCKGSDRINPEELSVALAVPPRDRLEISDVVADYEEGEGVIRVFTSQPVVLQGMKGLLKISPEIPFELKSIGNGFALKGNFADGAAVELSVSGKVRGIFGPELGNDQKYTVTFGALQPYLAFSDQNSLYLTPAGARNLGLNIINIPKIKVTVFKVFENNIQHFMRNGKSWNWYYEDDNYYDSYGYSLDENYGKVISTREIDTRALPRKGNIRLLNLKPEELELSADAKGLYLIKAESVEKSWLSDVQLVSVSDIGLIVRQGVDEIFVAARSISTAGPVEGVTIRFISRNNQMVHQVTTGADGTAIFRDMQKTIPGYTVTMISARKDQDFNVLLFDRSAVETSRFDAGGKRTAGLKYDAFFYGDRNLYRPGDSVFCNAIVRSFKWETIAELPVKFRILAPDGRDFMVRRAQLNKNGAATLNFSLPAAALTGTYVIEMLASNDVLMGSYRIAVEDFMPDRIRVDVKTDKNAYKPGQRLTADVTATNLFGPPASGRKVENELRISRKAFNPAKYPDFNFNIFTPADIYIENQVNEGATGPDGKLAQQFSLPGHLNIGILEARLFTTVFDETGRPVNRYTRADIYTQDYFPGIKRLPGWVSTQKPVNISLLSLNRAEKPASGGVRIEIVHLKWETVLERNYGQTSYRSQKKESIVFSREVTISPQGYTFQYSPPLSGEYQVRVSITGSPNYVAEGFYAYGWGDAGSSSFYVNREGEIGIETDLENFKPGDLAKVLFKTPFDGELLVTVEQDKVLEHHSLQASGGGATLNLKIGEAFMPNVYISATLIRKTDNSGLPLTVAHGYSSVKVDLPNRRLSVSIEAPAKLRSKVKQTVKIKTSPHAEVTIAVVDEGILQITDYKTPDPYHYFYQKRALEVTPYDLFDELFPELSGGRSSSGGDRGFDLGKRLNPLTSKRVKLLSLWSGVKKANAKGEVVFNISIPQFSGAVRVMALAYTEKQFGSGEKQIRIADPLVISSSLPRFLSPADEAGIMVTFTNTTDKPMTVKPAIKVSGPLKAGKLSEPEISIPPNSEKQLFYPLTAGEATGKAEVIVSAAAAGETFTESTEIGVRPAVGLEKTAEAGSIKGGQKVALEPATEFMEGTASAKLLLTRSPAGRYARDLSELVNYPYGCLEQTISAAFPQLYFDDLAGMLKQGHLAGKFNTSENVNEAILKIAALQQYNGGLVSWPSGGEAHWWNSAYAAHFLYEAANAGYSVNPVVAGNIYRYLTEKIKQKPVTEYFYKTGGSNQWQRRNQPNRETFYSLYVLALAGKQHLPTMNYYKARAGELSTDSRFMLACAYALAGDRRSFDELLPNSWDNSTEPAVMNGGSYSSPLRDRAIALYTLVNADPAHPMVAMLARQVGEMMNASRWMSTQERAFSLLALGRLAGQAKSENISASIAVKNRQTVSFKGEDLLLDISGSAATITTSGPGMLYYYLESEGIPSSPVNREEDRVLSVRRRMLDRNGAQVNPQEIRQNDLIVVEITLSTNDNSAVENVVVTDILPACFEVENTRLTADRGIDWAKDRSVPDYTDIRDDRVNLFVNAGGKQQKFYYMVRATAKGTFKQGPVSADAMYNGQYYSYHGSGEVRVK